MNAPADYIKPFIRRYRILFRIDTALHAIFLIPAGISFYRLTQWRDSDLLAYAILVVVVYGSVALVGICSNRALLRSAAARPILPWISSLLWIIAFPLVGVLGTYLLQARLPDIRQIDLSAAVGVIVAPPWFVLWFVMAAYKALYLTSVYQYRVWSRRVQDLGDLG